MKRVLIVPSGTEVGLEIARCLKFFKGMEVIGLNSIRDHSEVVYEHNYYSAPYANSDEFREYVNEFCDRECIDIVFPAHDDATFRLAAGTNPGTLFAGPDKKLAEILRFKSKTLAVLNGHVPCPNIYDLENVPEDIPLFVKPDCGQGSRGAYKVSSHADINWMAIKDSKCLVQEFLPGEEVTVDCYTKRDGQLIYAQPRSRSRTLNGIAARTEAITNPIFNEYAAKISNVLGICGVWFFQMKKDKNGEFKLLEVANRVSGTMGFNRERGVNLPQIWAYELLGYPVSLSWIPNIQGEYVFDRAIYSKVVWSTSVSTIYVDFDDTIIFEGGSKINGELVGALFAQKINHGRRIILLTKHAGDINRVLKSLGIFDLFDEVIHLLPMQRKLDYILDENSIFIDDSYAERMDVGQALDIPCLGPDAITTIQGMRNK